MESSRGPVNSDTSQESLLGPVPMTGWQQGIGPSASSQMFQEWELLIHHCSWMTSMDWRHRHEPCEVQQMGEQSPVPEENQPHAPAPAKGWLFKKNLGVCTGGQGGCKPATCPWHKVQKHLGQHWNEHCQQNEGGLLYLMGSDSLKGNHSPQNLHFLFSLRKLIWVVTRSKYCPLVVQSSPLSFMVMGLQEADGDHLCWRWCRSESPQKNKYDSPLQMCPFTRYESSVIVKIIAAFFSAWLGSAFSYLSSLLCFQHSKPEEVSEL